jgi:carbamoyl-phosphate synthase small subunit
VVAVDYGLKRNILRCLATAGCKVTVVPAKTAAETSCSASRTACSFATVLAIRRRPANYAVPEIKKLVASGLPVFGICLGHQMLGLALGAKTMKMHQGHHGANHPVKDFTTGKVEITSMNHGFAVDRETLPAGRRGDARVAVRRLQLRAASEGQAGVLGAVSPEASPGPRTATISSRASST